MNASIEEKMLMLIGDPRRMQIDCYAQQRGVK